MEALATGRTMALIAQLPQDQAEAVVLRVVVGLDAKSAAKTLGKRPGAVRTAAHRGLKRLAELLGADGAERHGRSTGADGPTRTASAGGEAVGARRRTAAARPAAGRDGARRCDAFAPADAEGHVMADERYEWLDKDAAERLLRGEPVEAADEHARTQAARLSRALDGGRGRPRAGYAGDGRTARRGGRAGRLPQGHGPDAVRRAAGDSRRRPYGSRRPLGRPRAPVCALRPPGALRAGRRGGRLRARRRGGRRGHGHAAPPSFGRRSAARVLRLGGRDPGAAGLRVARPARGGRGSSAQTPGGDSDAAGVALGERRRRARTGRPDATTAGRHGDPASSGRRRTRSRATGTAESVPQDGRGLPRLPQRPHRARTASGGWRRRPRAPAASSGSATGCSAATPRRQRPTAAATAAAATTATAATSDGGAGTPAAAGRAARPCRPSPGDSCRAEPATVPSERSPAVAGACRWPRS